MASALRSTTARQGIANRLGKPGFSATFHYSAHGQSSATHAIARYQPNLLRPKSRSQIGPKRLETGPHDQFKSSNHNITRHAAQFMHLLLKQWF